jgi:hypothetical protein
MFFKLEDKVFLSFGGDHCNIGWNELLVDDDNRKGVERRE